MPKTLGLLTRKIISTSSPMLHKTLCYEEAQGSNCGKFPTYRLTPHSGTV